MSRKSQLVDHLQELAAAEKAANSKETSMPDDPNKTAEDRKLISLEEDHEVASWCESLGCSRGQLQEAVSAVGHSVEKVRDFLRGS